MKRIMFSRVRKCGAAVITVALLVGCSSSGSKTDGTDAAVSAETFAEEGSGPAGSTEAVSAAETAVTGQVSSPDGDPGVDDAGITGEPVGPIAVAASSSEAALAEQRSEAGNKLKTVTVEVTEPGDLAGKSKPNVDNARCSGPGNLVEGEPFTVSYTKADGKIGSFTLTALGSYEGPGTYSADAKWTDGSGEYTGIGSMFVYDDESSGEFALTAEAKTLNGVWNCSFKG
jgi:hypothetical protein